MKLANVAMDVLMEDNGMAPWEKVEHSIVQSDYNAKVYYDSSIYPANSDDGDAMQHDPFARHLRRDVAQIPPEIKDSLEGLNDLADGVKSVEILGLPGKMELMAKFTNFHIAPLINDLIEEAKANSQSEQRK